METSFNSDGCSWWFEGWWSACCVAHDFAEYIGKDRLQSDIELGICVVKESIERFGMIEGIVIGIVLGTTMFLGVRLGRPIYIKVKERYGSNN